MSDPSWTLHGLARAIAIYAGNGHSTLIRFALDLAEAAASSSAVSSEQFS